MIAAAILAAGCSGSLPKSVGTAPVLSVVTGVYPAAEMAQLIGVDKVAVVGIVPAGVDPINFQPTAAQTGEIRSAGLVVEVGGGFQPAIEAAARGARSVVDLRVPTAGADPYPWLDPTGMGRMVTALTNAMAAADPQAAPLFRRNATGIEAQISSLGIDWSSTLESCPGTTILTPDNALTQMAADYGLKDQVVAGVPLAGQIAALALQLKTGGRVAALTEQWVDDGGVQAVAAAAHLSPHAFNTLIDPPAAPSSSTTYFSVMERNLGVISSALGCNPNEQ